MKLSGGMREGLAVTRRRDELVDVSLAARAAGQRELSWAEKRFRGRALALLWMAGTCLVVMALLVPDSTLVDEPQVLVVAVVAVGASAVVWTAVGRLPDWAFDVAVACGSAVLALLVSRTGPQISPFAWLFVWQLGFAGTFLPLWRAAVQAVGAAALLAFAIAAYGGDFPVTAFFMAVATFAVVMALAGGHRRSLDAVVLTALDDARRDPLTGLLNRRGFHAVLDREDRRSARDRTPASVVVCDVDHFKAVNDGHGHAVGDAVLRTVASVIQEQTRGLDTAARIGGEEFAVVVAGAAATEAQAVAERMRTAIAEAPLAGVAVTASFGVAARDDTLHLALRRADAALYEAKRRGRNRTVVAGD